MSQIWDIDQIIAASTSPATDIQRLIDGFNTLRSNWSGAAEPAVADQVAYMLWADTTTGLLKQRNAANSAWITIGTLADVGLGLLARAGGNLTGGVNHAKTVVASAATPDIFATTVGNLVDYTGTITCTGFVSSPQAGAHRTLVCAAAAPFTAGANLLIDGVASGATYTAQAGEIIEALALTTTQFRLRLKTLLTLGEPVETTSGTAFDLSVPPRTSLIHLLFNAVSLSGSDEIMVQLGDAGGIETTGYVSTSVNYTSAGVVDVSSTTGFVVRVANSTRALSGIMTLAMVDPSTNLWVATHVGIAATTLAMSGGGSKALSAELTTVRVTRSGTNTFDAGSIVAQWEVR